MDTGVSPLAKSGAFVTSIVMETKNVVPTFTAIVGLIALFGLSIPLVRVVRHRDEKPFAAYLIFVVAFSFLASVTFFTLVAFAQRWPEVAAASVTLSPLGIVVLSVLPAFLLGLWSASRPPCKNPTL